MRSAIASSGPTCGRCARDCAAPTPIDLFDGYCQRLVIDGIAAVAGASGDGDAASAMERLWLHLASRPQRHRARAIRPRRASKTRICSAAPSTISSSGPSGGEENPSMRRRIEAGPDQRDFPILEEFFAARRDGLPRLSLRFRRRTATARREPASSIRSRPTAGAVSATTTRRSLQATLPALSLAMKAHAGHVIASGLLGDLSRRGRRTAGPCRLDHARFGRQSCAR